MLQRMGGKLLLASLMLLPLGCGPQTTAGPPVPKTAPADSGQVTLHVKDMARRLGLT
jgi:hypothetical protein